jgi:hypothetical protein
LETRIVPERIEHRIEPEQCRSERYVDSQERFNPVANRRRDLPCRASHKIATEIFG